MRPVLRGIFGVLGIDPKQILDSVRPAGELVLMAIVFAETGLLVGFFLPGDSLLIIAGVLASQGNLDLALAVPACFIGAFAGSEVGYIIGQRLGPRLFTKQESRFFKQEYVERTHQFFDRHGPRTIVLSRFVPIVRTFTPVMAGVASMRRRVYTTYNLIGALLWAVGLVMLGWVIGDSLGTVDDVKLLPIVAVVVIVSFIPVIIEWRRARRRHDEPKSETAARAEAQEIQGRLDTKD